MKDKKNKVPFQSPKRLLVANAQSPKENTRYKIPKTTTNSTIITASQQILGTIWEHSPSIMPPMISTKNNYHAWLFRLWQENPYAPWRIALENITTGERTGFADLAALTVYLQAVISGQESTLTSDQKGES